MRPLSIDTNILVTKQERKKLFVDKLKKPGETRLTSFLEELNNKKKKASGGRVSFGSGGAAKRGRGCEIR